jgi:hypothetical protein
LEIPKAMFGSYDDFVMNVMFAFTSWTSLLTHSSLPMSLNSNQPLDIHNIFSNGLLLVLIQPSHVIMQLVYFHHSFTKSNLTP